VTEEENTKKCTKCKEVKGRSEFHKCKRAKGGLATDCKACHKLYAVDSAIRNKLFYDENKDSLPETKTCGICKEEKDLSAFSKNKSNKDGLGYTCKACHKSYMDMHKEEISASNKAWREENKIHLSEYKRDYREENRPMIQAQQKAYHEIHRERILARQKTYYEENLERELSRRKAYHEANRPAILEKQKAYQEANPEKEAKRKKAYREANPEKQEAYSRAYYESNKERMAIRFKAYYNSHLGEMYANVAKRRAAKLRATPLWFEKEAIKSVYVESTMRSKTEGVKYHVDHIVPLQSKLVCGLHCLANLQIITATENLRKNNRYWPGKEWILS
jgi:hypothetical protein